MPTYIYAIARAGHPAPPDGLTGVGEPAHTIRVLKAGGLSLVAGDAPTGLRARRRDVLAHQLVLERLLDDGPVLPMRFGLVAPDDDEAVAAIAAREEEYQSRLTAVEGCREYNLKVTRQQDDALREVLEEVPEAKRLNDLTRQDPQAQREKVALGELLSREMEARRESEAQQVAAALTPRAERTSVAAPVGDGFLNASFLVRRDRAAAFLEAVHAEAERRGDAYTFHLNGPLPPYSFV
ncbi:GvpL/GvpF family gas vesicle protein [Actinacidiphila acididurans]|uniref:GvpL/GvpF family gas vesicle protein n=1 Tax=Actinacidiphila acididurans TaxID=2784346 RepID=A0ABS2TSK8_9ACTN|nr:GvpL/GvpF family gas vesicle protein [Actinacidiphila acididurans]MBM9506323.1 GvpL/GvpF family gas vesicle protein [Actinacidiphila acididurans]